ncbi:MAG: MBL fold metallo-hydrolase [Sediminibacterium sp.]|nr:MBL fold metallo-hydrolase [Sediminibacterium sp.]
MKITFWGAARQVTGSMHVLDLPGGTRVLIDCGLDYENRKEFEAKNERFPFDPESIDLVVLTHAHIDHSGNLPNLIRQGFSGKIVSTAPTLLLSEYLLNDSLNIQRMELAAKEKAIRRKRGIKGKNIRLQPLYAKKHIQDFVDMAVQVDYEHPYVFNDELQLSLHQAGHILGAASVRFEITHGNVVHRVGFTGDLGNANSKLVPDPHPMEGLDYLISESTYGGRKHMTDSRRAEEILLDEVTEVCVQQGGKLVIPAFSVGRTQAIIFTLHQLYRQGKLPNIKIITDSPLAIRSTHVYQQHISYLNEEAHEFQRQHGGLFNFPLLHVVEDDRESELLSVIDEPCVIISAAGMVEGGRIQMHVRNNIGNDRNRILIAGFCAEGTLGWRLLQGQDFVEINHKSRPVRASIRRTDVFSAHPDHEQMVNYFEKSHASRGLKGLFLVHGDFVQMQKLAGDISFCPVHLPAKGEVFQLN